MEWEWRTRILGKLADRSVHCRLIFISLSEEVMEVVRISNEQFIASRSDTTE